MRFVIAGTVALFVLAAAPASYAQGAAPAGPATAPPKRTPTSNAPVPPEKMEEARQRFERGLQLFEEKNYEAARVEFERAYSLAPSWKLLYNIGLCYGQRGDYVEAIKDLEQYLKEGGDEVPKPRVEEVNKELANLRPRVAQVTVKTNVPDADLQIDDAPQGKLTSEPIRLNPGRRKIGLSKEGFFPATKVVTLAGSDKEDVTLDMKEIPKYVERKNPYVLPTMISWGATVAALLGTGVSAYFAKQADDDLATKRNSLGGPNIRSELDDQSSKTKTLALVTDICLGASIVGAGFGTYFTIRMLKFKGSEAEPEKKEGVTVGFSPGLGGGSIRGTF